MKRQLTQAELDEELRVGTVDLSEVELVAPREFWVNSQVEELRQANKIPGETDLTELLNAQFQANIARQQSAALASVVHDTRGAESVLEADQATSYDASSSLEGEEILPGGDFDQSRTPE